jgi:hypothetical protein
MEIGQVEDGEALENRRQARRSDNVLLHHHGLGIAPCATIEARDCQHRADDGLGRTPILDVEEVEAAAEDPRLVVAFDAETLASMEMTGELKPAAPAGRSLGFTRERKSPILGALPERNP